MLNISYLDFTIYSVLLVYIFGSSFYLFGEINGVEKGRKWALEEFKEDHNA